MAPFSNLPTHREKNVLLLSTEVRATQQNPRYSAKKQRRYTYDSDVYAKNIIKYTPVNTFFNLEY